MIAECVFSDYVPSLATGPAPHDIQHNLRTSDGTQVSNYFFNTLEQPVQRRTTAPGGPVGTVQYLCGLDGELLA